MKRVTLLLVFVYTGLTTISQTGTLDPNFGDRGIVRSNLFIDRGPAIAKKTFIQTDGKLLTVLQQDDGVLLGHFLNDGSFDPSPMYGYDDYSQVRNFIYGDAAQDRNGMIVVAGTRDHDFALTRFYTYGAVNLEIKFGFPDSAVATAVAIQRDGKIVVAGYTFIDGAAHFAVARCYPDGRLDSTFSGDGRQVTSNGNNGTFATSIALQSDNKILVGGYAGGYLARRDFALVRYNSDGSRDFTFSDDGKKLTTVGVYDDIASTVAIQGDGKILLSGRTQLTEKSSSTYAIATVRYLSNGKIDSSFNDDGIVITPVGVTSEAAAIVVQSDSKILIAGTVKKGVTTDFTLLRYNNNGSLDRDFGSNGNQLTDFDNAADTLSAVLLTNGTILVTGWTKPEGNTLPEVALARYTTEGKPDVSFSGDGKTSQYISTSNTVFERIIVQLDGKLIAVGNVDEDFQEGTFQALARYNPDGTYDTTFGTGGKVYSMLSGFGSEVRAVALQSDGKIIVASDQSYDNYDFQLVRYTANGILDTTFSDPNFGNKGVVYIDFSDEVGEFYNRNDVLTAIAIQPDDKIVAVGSTEPGEGGIVANRMAIARCNADGSLDTTFAGNGKQVLNFSSGDNESANAVTIQKDGKIVVAGTTFLKTTKRAVFAVARLNSDGFLDPSFSHDGKLYTTFDSPFSNASAIAIQSNNKIVVGGTSNGNFAFARYYSNGKLDTSFGKVGKQTTDLGSTFVLQTISLQPEGKIMAEGIAEKGFALARYNENGALDSTFATNGKQTTDVEKYVDKIAGIALSENRVYAAGFDVVYASELSSRFVGIIAAYRLEESTSLAKAAKTTELKEKNSQLMVSSFPNPAMQYFTIQTKSKSNATLNVRIMDATGRVMDTFQGLPPNGSLQVGTHYPPGVYIAELIQGNGKTTVKLIKSTH